MKNIKKGLIFVPVVVFVVFFIPFNIQSNPNPGSPQDPLVTQSYVDLRINDVLASLNQHQVHQTQELVVNEVLAALSGFISDNIDNTFVPVFVPAGSLLLGEEGTEIILRSGSAVANIPSENGIVNITTGVDIFNGEIIEPNNLLIVPRQDGRGVFAASDAWFMIKGSFNIVSN